MGRVCVGTLYVDNFSWHTTICSVNSFDAMNLILAVVVLVGVWVTPSVRSGVAGSPQAGITTVSPDGGSRLGEGNLVR